MNSFYSSLVISLKKFPNIHQLFKPRYNKEYFRRVTTNLTQLETLIEQRCRYPDSNLCPEKLKDLKEDSQKLLKLKEKLEKLEIAHKQTLDQLGEIEDRLMPTIISIPNRSSGLVPSQENVIQEIKSDFMVQQNLSKILSHRKLSYINNCYSKSVVGPNSHYYFGIGAKLQHALSSYFTNHLEREKFLLVSGLCLTKSAVVEASNSKDVKEYQKDPARIIGNNSLYTTLHLNESSRESLLGFITTLGQITSNNPLRLMTFGSSYRLGSDWFDGDDKRVTQTETVHALVLNSSIESYSMLEYHKLRDLVWSSYIELGLPARLVHCSNDAMSMNEFDAHRIDVWMPSRKQWIQVGRVSHYRDYITTRLGLKRGHMIDSMVYDAQVLVAALIENRQTALGKFIIPNILRDHLTYLTKSEHDQYLSDSSSFVAHDVTPKAQVLRNHEQRRYLVKRDFNLGHSKKAKEMRHKMFGHRDKLGLLTLVAGLSLVIDWEAIWCDYLSDGSRRFLYDYIRSPIRKLYFDMVCDENNKPIDEPYDAIDKTKYHLTKTERQRKDFYAMRERRV